MEDITYYDLRENSLDIIPQGSRIALKDMLLEFQVRFKSIFTQEDFVLDSEDINQISIIPADNRKAWVRLFRSIIFCISGQIADPKEVNLIIEIINKLNLDTKNKLDIKFIFAALPYLTVGFDFKAAGRSSDDVNTVGDGVALIEQLFHNNQTSAIIPLCAHRDANDTNKDQLVENINTQSIQRVANLIKGILENSPITNSEITFLQPRGSLRSSLFVYPNIFIKYIENGNLADFFALLETHYQEMQETLSNSSSSQVKFKLRSIDEFIEPIFQLASDLFGEGWLKCKSWYEVDKSTQIKQDIIKIAENVTAEHIVRFMPYFSENLGLEISKEIFESNINYARSNGFEIEVRDSMGWFVGEGKLTLMGKAIYETIFYYYWGKESAEKGLIGLGFERDHDLSQTMSWTLGYKQQLQYNSVVPLLYARRTKEIKLAGNLSEISFRQFWRLPKANELRKVEL